ncbi:thiamine pyrophosphate-dependent dehydrogenase E1 component subunit alpha [Enemella sp. A6]|uniref:thiamine pyrophosphate-dependent dehydrogenase E1 component subunit alpha n=1 Tax=Enemella sp. A6 TaxID=3440152 RepID=UPI003EBD1408
MVGNESVPTVQLLTPEGERVEHPDYEFSGSDEMIAGFLRDMVLVRRIDNEAHALQRQGQLGLWPSLEGQEAAQIGSGRAFGKNDYAFPSYREMGVGWAKGMKPVDMISLFRSVDMSPWNVNETTFHMYTLVIGSHALHATGYAMGLEMDGLVGNNDPERDASVTCYFGDGATSQGDVNEAFVFASSYNAPIVFFLQNNQWAISEPITRQSRIPLYQRAQGFGFPGIRVDGNDVLAVYAVTSQALERARSGNGPTLIEAFTYRMGAHTTSDDPTKYRLDAELEYWRLKDPIERVAAYLRRQVGIEEQFFTDLAAEADELAAEVRAQVLALPEPNLAEQFDITYAEQTPYLADQKQAYLDYADSFEEQA